MRKDKKRYVAICAGIGMIFGYMIWNAAIRLVFGAAMGLGVYALNKEKNTNT